MHTTTVVEAGTAVGELNFLWLEITGKCNLTCTHCYADSGPMGDLYGNMAFENWINVLDEAAELGCRAVQFIGGEPTMHPRLDDLVDHANHRNFELIEVFTNATRLGQDLLGCFQRNRVHVATSFYSDDPTVHENVTKVAGSWQRTVDGIRRVVSAGLPIRVGVIETDANAGHYDGAVRYLNSLGVSNVGSDTQRGVGRAGLVDIGTPCERLDQLCGECWKGKLCVTPSGECYPCVMARKTPVGHVSVGLTQVVAGQRLGAFRNLMASRTRLFEPVACDPSCNPNCWPNLTGPCKPSYCTPSSPPCAPQACKPGGNN